jgi:hypothetical protein
VARRRCTRALPDQQARVPAHDQALAAGWPIAAGVIKGVRRQQVGDRLDITAARWGVQGTEAILTLRAVISNGDFDEYWRLHLAQTQRSSACRVAATPSRLPISSGTP